MSVVTATEAGTPVVTFENTSEDVRIFFRSLADEVLLRAEIWTLVGLVTTKMEGKRAASASLLAAMDADEPFVPRLSPARDRP